MADQEVRPPSHGAENQGIPYKLRRIQILDGLILTAIIGVFSVSYSTDQKVTELLAARQAEREAEARLEERDPPIRRVRYELELDAVREHVRAIDGRVSDLEELPPR